MWQPHLSFISKNDLRIDFLFFLFLRLQSFELNIQAWIKKSSLVSLILRDNAASFQFCLGSEHILPLISF